MKHTITINVISPEEGIKIEGVTETTSFISMCISQSLQIMEEDLRQAKAFKKQVGKKYKNPMLDIRMNDLAKAVQEMKRIVKIYDASMWYINEKLDVGIPLEDIMKEIRENEMKQAIEGGIMPEEVKAAMKIVPKDEN